VSDERTELDVLREIARGAKDLLAELVMVGGGANVETAYWYLRTIINDWTDPEDFHLA
jgi:hypothetical protein